MIREYMLCRRSAAARYGSEAGGSHGFAPGGWRISIDSGFRVDVAGKTADKKSGGNLMTEFLHSFPGKYQELFTVAVLQIGNCDITIYNMD